MWLPHATFACLPFCRHLHLGWHSFILTFYDSPGLLPHLSPLALVPVTVDVPECLIVQPFPEQHMDLFDGFVDFVSTQDGCYAVNPAASE
jgi:hypothetical protein